VFIITSARFGVSVCRVQVHVRFVVFVCVFGVRVRCSCGILNYLRCWIQDIQYKTLYQLVFVENNNSIRLTVVIGSVDRQHFVPAVVDHP